MKVACIYLKASINQEFEEINSILSGITKQFKNEFSFIKILVDFEDFNQLDIFLNREIDNFDVLIIGQPINDEFYTILLKQLESQGQLKLISY